MTSNRCTFNETTMTEEIATYTNAACLVVQIGLVHLDTVTQLSCHATNHKMPTVTEITVCNRDYKA